MCLVSLVTLTHCYDYSTLIKSAISAILTNVGHVLFCILITFWKRVIFAELVC